MKVGNDFLSNLKNIWARFLTDYFNYFNYNKMSQVKISKLNIPRLENFQI